MLLNQSKSHIFCRNFWIFFLSSRRTADVFCRVHWTYSKDDVKIWFIKKNENKEFCRDLCEFNSDRTEVLRAKNVTNCFEYCSTKKSLFTIMLSFASSFEKESVSFVWIVFVFFVRRVRIDVFEILDFCFNCDFICCCEVFWIDQIENL